MCWSFSFLDCAVKPFRLCIHDRDFTVGQRITENIIENIAKSRKVCLATNTASLRRIKFVMVCCLCVFVGDYCSVSWLRRKQMVSVRAAFIAAPFARVRATWRLGPYPSRGCAQATAECRTEIFDEYEDLSGLAEWPGRAETILAAATSSVDGT